MRITQPASSSVRTAAVLFCAVGGLSVATLSAHSIVGLASRAFPSPAKAFVSSPSAGTDKPIPIMWGEIDSGLRVACFFVANPSQERADRPGWPRVTGAGFELPGRRSGFALLEPLDDNWELVEDTRVALAGEIVTLDFAIVARPNPARRAPGYRRDPLGIPPGQAGTRGSGTRFCVSGPFPDTLRTSVGTTEETTIELVINGVVVGFHGVGGTDRGVDMGVWDNAAREIPLFLKRR